MSSDKMDVSGSDSDHEKTIVELSEATELHRKIAELQQLLEESNIRNTRLEQLCMPTTAPSSLPAETLTLPTFAPHKPASAMSSVPTYNAGYAAAPSFNFTPTPPTYSTVPLRPPASAMSFVPTYNAGYAAVLPFRATSTMPTIPPHTHASAMSSAPTYNAGYAEVLPSHATSTMPTYCTVPPHTHASAMSSVPTYNAGYTEILPSHATSTMPTYSTTSPYTAAPAMSAVPTYSTAGYPLFHAISEPPTYPNREYVSITTANATSTMTTYQHALRNATTRSAVIDSSYLPYMPRQSVPPGSPPTSTMPVNSPMPLQMSNLLHSHTIRKLQDLPEFSGLPEQWPMFAIAYKETTDAYRYTNLENLTRLQKALKGAAKAKVEAFLIHPDSINMVMNTLEVHYGRPQILIKSQLAKAKAFPQISRISDIVDYSTMVSNLTAFLQNACATPHLHNPTLLDELVGKLPLLKREEWVRYIYANSIQYPSIIEFSQWLQNIAMFISIATETEQNRTDAVVNVKRDRTSKPTYAITTEYKDHQCLLCHERHEICECTKFRSSLVDERWKIAKTNRLCFCCLRCGHNITNCSIRRECGINFCKKYHHRLLHEERKQTVVNDNTEEVSNRENENSSKNWPNTDVTTANVATIFKRERNKKTLFKFLPVVIKGPEGCRKVMAFIDDGSKISLIEENVATSVGLKGPSDILSLRWIGGKTTSEVSQRLNIEIASTYIGANSFEMRNVRTTKKLELPSQTLDLENFRNKHTLLNDLPLEDYYDAVPQILIGIPHIQLVRPIEVINLDEHFAVHKAKLGYMLFGSNEDNTEAVVCRIDCEQNNLNEIRQKVHEYFAIEDFGVKPSKPVVSEVDNRAERILLETTKRSGNQYETGLLWREDRIEFQESYSMALGRLEVIEKKMKNDHDLGEWYTNTINSYISKSYARKLSADEAAIVKPHTWYLPHFSVCNVNKGNKRRLVFDAAASINGVSFNSRLMKGPSTYQPQPLTTVLFKFRQGKIGVCADIREMFHRVKIREDDQTAQRFLWRNGNLSVDPDVYVMTAMIFGSVSSPCSAQYVKNINAENWSGLRKRAKEAIIKRHYVDDYVDSFDNIDEAIEVARDVSNIHGKAGFEFKEFLSNSAKVRDVLNKAPTPELPEGLARMFNSEVMTEKILGMFWRPQTDEFCFVLKFTKVPPAVLSGKRRLTKSEVLSLTMSIYDPCGFLANIVIRSKILLQELWRVNVGWDTAIPDEVYGEWYKWYSELVNVENISVPRCYHSNFLDPKSHIDLHVFVDASELAFSAVVYWRICCANAVDVVFVAGKSRCSPLKPLSIPRLELQAAVLGVRLMKGIVESHDVSPREIVFWSDSKTVINWIGSDSRCYKQFVAHRIAEILDSTDVEQWRWVPGSLNPADDATRLKAKKQTNNSRWISGPEFLKLSKDNWPSLPTDISEHLGATEMRSKSLLTISESERFIDFARYSNYYNLLRVMCWVRRAVVKFKEKGKMRTENRIYLSASELKAAEIEICRIVQKEAFGEEIQLLSNGKPLPKGSTIYSLTPILDRDNILRLAGRIDRSICVTEDTRRPIILPKVHALTTLIVRYFHELYRHQNQGTICSEIRRKFPCIRQVVRSASANCQLCKNIFARPKPPLMGQLPEDRLTPFVRAFSYTGLDYFGPYAVTIGRRHEKRWAALFTCMSTRAIHIELAKDLSADSAIVCLRNFMNRRGVPVRIRSDRGTNFVGASKEELVLIDESVASECARRGVEWLFNTPANPSAGGVWERMVRSVKRVLSFVLKEKAPQVETLISLLIEAENLINSRPLTHLPLESDSAEPLTPNHFLLGGPNSVQTPMVNERVCLRKQWHVLQQLKQSFWKRWVLEYLPELTRRTKWHQYVKPIQINDIVIICDDNESRGEWKRGIVTEVFPASDGQVRSATVKTSAGFLRRPASKLAVLDVMGESVSGFESRADSREVGCCVADM